MTHHTPNLLPVFEEPAPSQFSFPTTTSAAAAFFPPAGALDLGISLSQNEPVNANNQLLFTVDQPTTGQRGAASGLNPTTLSTFNGGTTFPETGTYSIAVSVPEPTTTAALAFGGLASLVFLRRLRRRQTV